MHVFYVSAGVQRHTSILLLGSDISFGFELRYQAAFNTYMYAQVHIACPGQSSTVYINTNVLYIHMCNQFDCPYFCIS